MFGKWSEFNKQAGSLRRFAIFQNSIWFIESTIIEALIGLIAAWIVTLLIGMLPGLLEQILPSLVYNKEAWEKIRAVLNLKTCWAVLFGVRFVIRYLTNGFNGFVSTKKGD